MVTTAIPNKVIITCALTGGFHGKEANPNLPEQPDEIVAQGVAAWKAGAAILHVHARNKDGSVSSDKEIYRELHERLCRETDAIVQLTTGGGIGLAPHERLVTTLLSPEMCSLNMGFLNFQVKGRDWLFANTSQEIVQFAKEMQMRGIRPELEVYNIAMLEEVEKLMKAKLIEPPYYINFVLNTPTQGGQRGTWLNLMEMVRRLPDTAFCNVTSMGSSQLPLTTIAMAMGLNVRTGMEDNVQYKKGQPVQDNAQLVERTVRIAHELNLEPAKPEEVRQALKLRGRNKGEKPALLVDTEEPVSVNDTIPTR